MVTETKTTIELRDVIGLEIGCKHCGATVTRRVREILAVPTACSNCGADLLDFEGSTKRAIEELARILKHPALIDERDNFTLRLLITEPKPAEK